MAKWLLFIAALLGIGVKHVKPHQEDYIGLVAAEAAYASLIRAATPVTPAPPVDPKNCPTCGGTGRVKTGDGQGWTKCPTCKPITEPAKPVMPMTVPPKPDVGFPARVPGGSVGRACPDGTCPLRVYQTLRG